MKHTLFINLTLKSEITMVGAYTLDGVVVICVSERVNIKKKDFDGKKFVQNHQSCFKDAEFVFIDGYNEYEHISSELREALSEYHLFVSVS